MNKNVFDNLLTMVIFLIGISCAYGGPSQDIKNIRQWYSEVESRLKKCEQLEISWLGFEAYDDIEGFYDRENGNWIKLIAYEAPGDWAEKTTSFYLRDNQPFFIFEKGYTADEMLTADERGLTEEENYQSGLEAKTLLEKEARIYVKNNKVIEVLIKEKIFPVDAPARNLGDVENIAINPSSYPIEQTLELIKKIKLDLEKKSNAK